MNDWKKKKKDQKKETKAPNLLTRERNLGITDEKMLGESIWMPLQQVF